MAPKYRQLHCKIVESFSVNDMPDDFTRLFWVLLPIALDSEGRGISNPVWIRSKLFPLRMDVTDQMIGAAYLWLHEHGMINIYTVEGRTYFNIPTWHEYQTGTDKEAPSHLPAPEEAERISAPGEPLLQSNSRPTPELVQSNSASINNTTAIQQQEQGKSKTSARAPDAFSEMQSMIERNLGYPCNGTEDIIAINKFIERGVVEDDIKAALEFFKNNGKVARSAAHLQNSVFTAVGKRVQATSARASPNGSKPRVLTPLQIAAAEIERRKEEDKLYGATG